TDFYRPLRPHHPEKWYVLLSRVMTAVWGVAQMSVAYAAYKLGGDKSVVEQVLAAAGFPNRLLVGPVIPRRLLRPVRAWAAVVGMGGGVGGVGAVWLPSVFGTPVLAWPWFAPVGAGTTVLVALLLDRLVSRDPV